MSRALIQTAHARRLDKDKGAGERPPGTSAGHQGTVDGRLRLASGAKMPARPNTAVSVKGTDILHLPNEWALDGAKDLDEKDFLLGVVKQVCACACACTCALLACASACCCLAEPETHAPCGRTEITCSTQARGCGATPTWSWLLWETRGTR
jgi:hypothetical protein